MTPASLTAPLPPHLPHIKMPEMSPPHNPHEASILSLHRLPRETSFSPALQPRLRALGLQPNLRAAHLLGFLLDLRPCGVPPSSLPPSLTQVESVSQP